MTQMMNMTGLIFGELDVCWTICLVQRTVGQLYGFQVDLKADWMIGLMFVSRVGQTND